jgi:hypothetical protein
MSRFCPALVVACLLLSACAPKLHYRITRINGVPSIAPPGYRDQTPPPDVRVTIDGVTAPNAKTGDCNLSLNEFALEWGGGTKRRVTATVKLNALFPDGAYDEVARQAFHQFQIALEKLEEEKGCLVSGGSWTVAHRVAEAMPMPFQDVVCYIIGYNPQRGYIDLRPGMRILQQAVQEHRDPKAKVETQEVAFDVTPGATGHGVTFTKEDGGGASDWALDLRDKRAPHYRLFLRIRFFSEPSSVPERDSVLVGAAKLEQLQEATIKLAQDAPATCSGQLTRVPPECTVFPRRVTAGPEIGIRLKGKPAYVPIASSLHNLMVKEKGMTPQKFLSKLELQRLYAGKYFKVKIEKTDLKAIGLPLVVGDKVRW